MILDITAEQMTDACRTIYAPGRYEHAPAQVFYDHAWGRATYIRCSFPDKFTHAAATKLDQLRALLKGSHGVDADVVICVYYDRLDPDALARHAIALADR